MAGGQSCTLRTGSVNSLHPSGPERRHTHGLGSGGFIHTRLFMGEGQTGPGAVRGQWGQPPRLPDEGRSDCRVEPRSEKHGVGLCGGPGQAQVAFTGRSRWNKGTALQLPLLSDPLAGTPPLTKPNQEARGSWVLWTRPMLAGLPGPRAWGRRAVSRAGQRTR